MKVLQRSRYVYNTESIGAPGQPYLQSNSGRDPTTTVWSLQGKVDYARTFGRHDVGATLVYHMKETKKVKDGGGEYDLLPYREQGVAGRLTYDFDHRYLVEATFGYNGSENFMKGKRFGFFPAVAAGWTISNEHFFKKLKPYMHNLKIRTSYGLVGNDALASRFPLYYHRQYVGRRRLVGWRQLLKHTCSMGHYVRKRSRYLGKGTQI